MSNEAKKPIVNIADVPLHAMRDRGKFGGKWGRIGPMIGSPGIGCAVLVVPPGKRAWPFHVHHANHELFVILEGEGDYRFGGDTYPVKAGDVLAAPAGGPEFAHQIVNTGKSDLRYLALSTMTEPEVVEYPDSGKFAVTSLTEGGDPRTARLRFIGRKELTADYWDGEA